MIEVRSRFQGVIVFLAVLFVVSAWLPLADAGESGRIVAIGDVHGSFVGLGGILEEANVIDSSGRWIGGSTILIQQGDLLDRGLQLQEVMDLLMKLQREAPKTGGEVICLLGNHESMNLLGLVRDVNPEVYAAFADKKSKARRDEAFAAMTRHLATRADLFGTAPDDAAGQSRDEWMARYPLGKLEYLEALGPDGVYGKWFRSLEIAVRRNDTLFVHAGLGPALQGQDPKAINIRATAELRHFDRFRATLAEEGLILPCASVNEVAEVSATILALAPEAEGKRGRKLRALAKDLDGATGIGGWYLVHQDGPLWFRGAALWNEQENADQIEAILDQLKVDRMVVGHTVMRDGTIKSRFGGRVLAIDTGMLSEVYEGGRASALEIVGDTVSAIYVGERFLLVDGQWQAVVPCPEIEVASGN